MLGNTYLIWTSTPASSTLSPRLETTLVLFLASLRLYCSLQTTDAREKMSRDALISKRLVAKYDVVLKLTHWLVRPSPLISQLFGFPDWIISTGVCLRTVLCHLADKEL